MYLELLQVIFNKACLSLVSLCASCGVLHVKVKQISIYADDDVRLYLRMVVTRKCLFNKPAGCLSC